MVFKPLWVKGSLLLIKFAVRICKSPLHLHHSLLVIMSQLIGLMSKLVMQHCHTLMVELEVIHPTANSESKQFQIPMEFNVRRVTSAAVRSVRFCIINRVQLAWTPAARPWHTQATGPGTPAHCCRPLVMETIGHAELQRNCYYFHIESDQSFHFASTSSNDM